MSEFIAYIDEAGDEGFGKLRNPAGGGGQSSWLILGAMIVAAVDDPLVPQWKREIRSRFPTMQSPDLHWSRLGHDKRVVVSSDLSVLPMRAALTLSHKVTISGSRWEGTFKRPGYLYNYLTRWLLERLIDWCERQSRSDKTSLRVVFSKRRGTNYGEMKRYLHKLSDNCDKFRSPRNTNWSVLDIEGIEVEDHSKRAGLQLADCVTSAFFTALEPNRYGNTEPSYAQRLIGNLIKNEAGQTVNTGLTVVPGLHAAAPNEPQLRFLRKCWGGWTPGP